MTSFIQKTFGKVFGRIIGISLCPIGIYVVDGCDEYVVNHERIHYRQQLEMLIIPFYIWYIVELIIRRYKCKRTAYTSLCFEREAFRNQYDMNYLKNRKPYSWVKHLKK